MPSPPSELSLSEKLIAFRRRIRRLTWLSGLGTVVLVAVPLLAVFAIFDWGWHLESLGLRVGLLVLFTIGVGFVLLRSLLRPLLTNLDDLALARLLERRLPFLADRLSSGVQFRAGNFDPERGAPGLQQNAATAAEREVQHIDIRDQIDPRPVHRRVVFASLIVIGVGLLAGSNPGSASIALTRFFVPWSNTAWPRTTDLVFVNADLEPLPFASDDASPDETAARGEPVKLYVRNRLGTLPEDLTFEVRIDGGEVSRDRGRTITLRDDDDEPQTVGFGRWEANAETIEIRAVGGDDAGTRWRRIALRDAPRLESLTVTVTPPEYLSHVETLTTTGPVRGWAGSRVVVQATAREPLSRAMFHLGTETTEALTLSEDDRSFSASFLLKPIANHPAYSFTIVDREGFPNRRPIRYDVQVRVDQPPRVELAEPDSDTLVTPLATLDVRGIFEDDHSLRSTAIVYRVGESDDSVAEREPLLFDTPSPQRADLRTTWALEPLSLPVGTRMLMHLEATDGCELPAPQTGVSSTRAITIVSPEDKQAELAARQSGLLDDLLRTREQFKEAQTRTDDLIIQQRQTGKLRPQDRATLRNLDFQFRQQLRANLTGDEDDARSVLRRTGQLLDELERNRVDAEAMQRRLKLLQSELQHLERQSLNRVGEALHRGLQESEGTDSERLRKALDEVHGGQSEVVRSLSALLSDLTDWQATQSASGELADLIEKQTDLRTATEQVGRRTLGQSVESLAPQQRAELEKLVKRQTEHTEAVEELMKKLQQPEGEKSDGDSSEGGETPGDEVSKRLRETAQMLKDRGVPEKLRRASRAVQENRTGEASELQRQTLEDLQAAEDLLTGRTVSDAETLLKNLDETTDELETLTKKQRELQEKTKEQGTEPDEPTLQQLKKEQTELEADAERLARRTRTLRAEDASSSLARSAEAMRSAASELDENSDPEAAAERQEQARLDLEQASREVADAKRQIEREQQRERLRDLTDRLPNLIEVQTAIHTELEGIAKKTTGRRLSRSLLKSIRDLKTRQEEVIAETETLQEVFPEAAILRLAFDEASRSMRDVVEGLDERDAGPRTQGFASEAVTQLTSLLRALRPVAETPVRSEPPTPPAQQANGNEEPPAPVPPATELRLLRDLQEQLNLRTANVAERQQRGETVSEKDITALGQLQAAIVREAKALTAKLQPRTEERLAP